MATPKQSAKGAFIQTAGLARGSAAGNRLYVFGHHYSFTAGGSLTSLDGVSGGQSSAAVFFGGYLWITGAGVAGYTLKRWVGASWEGVTLPDAGTPTSGACVHDGVLYVADKPASNTSLMRVLAWDPGTDTFSSVGGVTLGSSVFTYGGLLSHAGDLFLNTGESGSSGSGVDGLYRWTSPSTWTNVAPTDINFDGFHAMSVGSDGASIFTGGARPTGYGSVLVETTESTTTSFVIVDDTIVRIQASPAVDRYEYEVEGPRFDGTMVVLDGDVYYSGVQWTASVLTGEAGLSKMTGGVISLIESTRTGYDGTAGDLIHYMADAGTRNGRRELLVCGDFTALGSTSADSVALYDTLTGDVYEWPSATGKGEAIAMSASLSGSLPAVDGIADTNVNTASAYTQQMTNIGGAGAWWRLNDGPTGATISTSGLVSWPTPVVTGSPHTFTVSAGGANGWDSVSWDVWAFTVAPVVTAIADDIALDGGNYQITPSLSAGDTPVVWSLDSSPGGATIDPDTGVINWTATGTSASWVVRASNVVGFDTEAWTTTVISGP